MVISEPQGFTLCLQFCLVPKQSHQFQRFQDPYIENSNSFTSVFTFLLTFRPTWHLHLDVSYLLISNQWHPNKNLGFASPTPYSLVSSGWVKLVSAWLLRNLGLLLDFCLLSHTCNPSASPAFHLCDIVKAIHHSGSVAAGLAQVHLASCHLPPVLSSNSVDIWGWMTLCRGGRVWGELPCAL